MNKQLLAGCLIITLTLLAYFTIGILLTGEAVLLVGVLLLVLLIWVLLYKLINKNLGNIELVMRMYADLKDTLERIKARVAKDEAPRRAATYRRRQGLTNRESRKADRPQESSTADKKYADIIERRVREAKANQDQSERTDRTDS